jgi:rhodanese-related sulfurtransferase
MSGRLAEVSPRELADRLAAGEAIALLDVREPEERALCAIGLEPPAVELHVTMGQLPAQLEAIRRAVEGRPLVVYCHHGVRSEMAARWLAARLPGSVANLVGGVDAWSLTVDPKVPRY